MPLEGSNTTVGNVALGNSVVGPNLVEYIDNLYGNNFITVENRYSMSVGVMSAYQQGAEDSSIPFTVPALTRATVPIDPGRGVQLTVSNSDGTIDRSNGVIHPRNYIKRNIPYRLHNDGLQPQEELYPPQSWVPSAADFNVTVGGANPTYYCIPVVPANNVASGGSDTCFVNCCIFVASNTFSSNAFLEVDGLFDPNASPFFETLALPIWSTDPVGTIANVLCRGCIGLRFSAGGTSGTVGMSVLFGLGFPGE